MLTSPQFASRDWYLEQLGIPQYQLRHPHALCGKGMFALSKRTRLIIIAETCTLNSAFMVDLLAAIGCDPSSLLLIKPTQIAFLPTKMDGVIWIMGNMDNLGLPYQSNLIIRSPAWNELVQSAQHKRQLWRQLSNYEHYFQIAF